MVTVLETAGHGPAGSLVVKRNTMVPVVPTIGVNVAFNKLASSKLPVPPLTTDQVPDVALPPIVPAKVAVFPWQIV